MVATSHFPRAILSVDLGQIQQNLLTIRQAVGPLHVMAVLKANAYGLGLEPVAKALAAAGADRFGVANVDEALQVLPFGKPVQILGAVLPEEVAECVARGIVTPVCDELVLAALMQASQTLEKPARVQVLVDTGMGRLGVLPAEAAAFIQRVNQTPGMVLEGVYSHFPSAYDDLAFSEQQITLLKRIVEQAGVPVPLMHIANSDGINNVRSAFQAPFNMVRTGINLYGYFDMQGARDIGVQPVIELRAKLISVRTLTAGMSVGYGRTYPVDKPTRIGTVAIGYADGLPMQLCQGGHLIVRGVHCPIVGRVSMDYTTLLLDHVPEAQAGDDVLCLGPGLSLEEWVLRKGTAPYEVICALGQRVDRAYIT